MRPVLFFIALSYGLAWLVCAPLWFVYGADPAGGGADPTLGPVLFTVCATAVMATPALAAVTTELIWPSRPRAGVDASTRAPLGERAKSLHRVLGLWPLTPWKRTAGIAALLYLGFWVFFLAQPFLASLVGAMELDLRDFSLLRSQIAMQSGDLPSSEPPVPLWGVVLAQAVAAPLLGLINTIPCAGEELGWRGWLLPRLMPLGTWPALLLHGLIWGVWHAPLTLLGHNYGLFDWRGILFMSIFCVLMGIVLGAARLWTDSVWPAIFGHASINATAGFGMMLGSADNPPDLVIAGGAGAVTWGMLAIIIAAGIGVKCVLDKRSPH